MAFLELYFTFIEMREVGVKRRGRWKLESNFLLLLPRLEEPLNFVLLGGGQALVMLALITPFLFTVFFVLVLN